MAFSDRLQRLNANALRRFGVQVLIDGVPAQGDFASALKAHEVDGMAFSAREPICVVADADVPADAVGKLLVHNGVTYTIQEVRADSFGLSQLVLQRGL